MKRLQALLAFIIGISILPLIAAQPVAMADSDIPKVTALQLIPHMTPLKGITPAQWRVIWNGDASREATIAWSTEQQGTRHRVLYGRSADQLDFVQECQVNAPYGAGDKPLGAYFHHATLRNLQPGSDCYFAMESDGERSRTLYFRTAPASGTGFSILHGGDSRSGLDDRCRMNLLIAAFARDDKNILALGHGGDYIKSGQSWDEWRMWLSHHELITAPDGRVLPIIPVRGNHDRGVLYYQVFNLNQTDGAWNVTRIGKDVTMVTLDTNASAAQQAEWLEKQLSSLRPQSRWLMVQYHLPMYPAIKGPAQHAPVFCPLFDKYNVDIALESDGHCMKRTVPIRDGKKDPTGLIYVGEGGLGVQQKKPNLWQWYLKDGGVGGSGHHVMRLDFTDETLRCRFIRMNGETWDDYTLKAR